jgi:hypothetical protein
MHAIKELFMLAANQVFYSTEKIVFLSATATVKIFFFFLLFLSLNVVLLYEEHLASHFFYIQRRKIEGSSCLNKKKYGMLRPILFSLVKRVIQKNIFVFFINGLCLRLENKVLKGVNYLVSNFMNSTTVSCFRGK